MAENDRTQDARDHDDHALIDAAVANADTAAAGSSAGGLLQTDVGTQNDLARAVDDPEAMTRPRKDDDIASDQAYNAARGGNDG